MNRLGIGVVGCGNIAPIYLKNLNSFDEAEVVAVADLIAERAESRSQEFGVERIMTFEEMLEEPSIEVILNITRPESHYEIAKRALASGRHVYNEKSVAIDVAEADELLQIASEKGVRLGCAPDTVLGAGIQTCRKLIDEGAIGEPFSAQAFMLGSGPESWHPDPEFFYKKGGGPLFDMGPYYISALVTLLGPVERVSGAAKRSFGSRTITSEPKNGAVIEVEVPTHLVTVMEFAGGAVGQLTTSFDVRHHTLPNIQIFGSEGTIQVPDPNTFGGPVLIRTKGDWEEVALTHPNPDNMRGLGLLDMVQAVNEGRAHRASGDLARHALAVFHATHAAPLSGQYVKIDRVERPAAMPALG